ncbi:lipid-A-disaccharide synthase [Chelatococcus reniformis]|uniref:Lipid-A-disaccharide synthase n=1 Tax=Chelatococcus reniformis TaxID=1494448 RepID=A0A916UEF3_9HYPH|nr:lipid-A-disaccharide synthase [Chelatococcus reniformis]GGC69492.1 lipid-A-disaccharide synthase [Chelatococcus reniformis]
MTPEPPLSVFLVAGEESGDQLGAGLMRAIHERLGDAGVAFAGVGGERMAAVGLTSLFPLSDIAVMGVSAVVARLPTIVRRVYATVDAVVAAKPDVLVIIDSPDFTHNVAKRVRARMPGLPIVDYVSPTVWAWRPGRARAMRAYVDHLLALLPFEPEAHRRLGGPACSYVGHPLVERLAELRPRPGERANLGQAPTLLVLPGSRRTEISRLMEPFGAALGLIAQARPDVRIILPAVPHLKEDIAARAASWPVRPDIVTGEASKWAAFRQAHAAVAASGTVTLELALAGVPMVVAYKVSFLEERLRFLVKVPSIVLPNLILGANAIPEFIQEDCTADALAEALLPLLGDTPPRRTQVEALARLDALMSTGSEHPSERGARIVLETAGAPRSSRQR